MKRRLKSIGVHIRLAVKGRQGMLFSNPKMLFDDIIGFRVVGSNWSTNLIAFDMFLSHNVSSDTEVGKQ